MCAVFDLILYKEGFLLMGADSNNPEVAASPIAQEKMYHAFTDYLAFNRVIGVDDAGDLNNAVAGKETAMLINVAEALHDKKIGRISDEISRRYAEGGAKVVRRHIDHILHLGVYMRGQLGIQPVYAFDKQHRIIVELKFASFIYTLTKFEVIGR